MSTVITAANATNGMSFTPDNTGILEFKTGSGAGTTALTLSSSQIATFSTGVGLPTGQLYPLVSGTSISTATTSFTGSTSGVSTTLTAASVTGTIQIGQVIAGTGIVAGTSIIAQVSGTTGGAGTYTLSQASSGTVSGTITVVGVDFYNIPSTAKRITVMFSQVSTSGTSPLTLRLGTSGGVVATGYLGGSGGIIAAAGSSVASTTGFRLGGNYAANLSWEGAVTLTLLNPSTNLWVANGSLFSDAGTVQIYMNAGTVTLSGVATTVRITSDGGTDTFDAGSINIMWE